MTGQVAPTVKAIKEAKEAERGANEVVQRVHADQQIVQQLLEELAAAQIQRNLLTGEIEDLTQKIAQLQTSPHQVNEVPTTPPEVLAQLEALQQSVHILTQQRDTLSKQVVELGEQARTAALKRDEDTQEQRIRLTWYRVTTEFRTCVTRLLSQWPSSLDVLVFETDDWARLSCTKDLARRFLEECTRLAQGTDGSIVDGSMVPPKEVVPSKNESPKVSYRESDESQLRSRHVEVYPGWTES
jgi:hypothetical protein